MTSKIICYLCIFAIAALTNGMKVDLQGALRVGKEVMDRLTNYFRRDGGSLSGRRVMSRLYDDIAHEIKTTSLCRNLDLCKDVLYKFVNKYVTSLAKAVEGVFDGVFIGNAEKSLLMPTPILGGCLRDIKKILKKANKKMTHENESYIWVMVIKKISATFQSKLLVYIADRLNGQESELVVIRKRLSQKAVIAISRTELKYQNNLCYDYRICLYPMECTKTLNNVLETVVNQTDDKIKAFIRAFYELLPDTNFYTGLSEVTSNEFQVILSDMAFGNHVSTSEVLSKVQKVLDFRLNPNTKEDVKPDPDVVLVLVIMSDMDFFLSKGNSDPFHVFLNEYIEWTTNGGRVNTFMKKAIRSIQSILLSIPEALAIKLKYEVRVLLEITIDPEMIT